MAISEREKHIEMLEDAKSFFEEVANNPNNKETLKTYLTIEALDYAISSLKTDLKYDLMYEGEEVYTKDEVIAMLTELQLEIEECIEDTENYSDYNAGLRQGICAIQQKINKLKENTDGTISN